VLFCLEAHTNCACIVSCVVQVNYMARDMVAAASSAAGAKAGGGMGEGVAGIARMAELQAQARVGGGDEESSNKRKFVPASSSSAPPPEKRLAAAAPQSNPDEIDIDDVEEEDEASAIAEIGVTQRPVPAAVFGSVAESAVKLGALERFQQQSS
jgi:hypothetical protein